ncbi:MAG: DUF4190 domain-containing protein [Candidatus Omnitrophica bacterium]|nr:DUF4190 domain-containing protein [Candidatus Omnitrophota bacterium]
MNEQKGIRSEFAIASLVMGIVSFFQLFGAEKAIAAIVFGILALKRINITPQLRGKKIAVAGIILSLVYIIIAVVFALKFWPQLVEKLTVR